jgi:hypothetical protein
MRFLGTVWARIWHDLEGIGWRAEPELQRVPGFASGKSPMRGTLRWGTLWQSKPTAQEPDPLYNCPTLGCHGCICGEWAPTGASVRCRRADWHAVTRFVAAMMACMLSLSMNDAAVGALAVLDGLAGPGA